MAQPPRVPILLPEDKTVVYFVTLCVEGRKPVLAEVGVFDAFRQAVRSAVRWQTLAATLMPDHLHILASPCDRPLSIGLYSAAVKRWTWQGVAATWKWQRGCFDRILRSQDSAAAKWAYIRDNPVRAGLVDHWEKWP